MFRNSAAEKLLLQAIKNAPRMNWGFRVNKNGCRNLTAIELEELEVAANQSSDAWTEKVLEILNN